METSEKENKLLENLSKIEYSSTNHKTAFLDSPKVKEALTRKFKEGIPMRLVHKAIIDSGFKISVPTLRKWKEKNIGVRKRKNSNN